MSTLRVAARNVVRHRRRSVLTLCALFLAVFLVVLVRGMLNAMDASWKEAVIEGQVGALQVHRAGYLRSVGANPLVLDMPADAAFLDRLRAVPGVRAVSARIPFAGMAGANDRTALALVLAVDPADEARVCPKRFRELSSGTPPGAEGGVFTEHLLRRLGARLGDPVVLLAADRDGVLNGVQLRAVGTMPHGGELSAEKKVVTIPLHDAQVLLRMPDRATEIALAVEHVAHADTVAVALRGALGPGFEVTTWRELTAFVEETMEKQDVAVSWISNVFLLMALLGIANTMLIAVRERTREIGTLLALGMRRRRILGMFLAEAALLGVVGAGLGVLVGGVLVEHLGSAGVPMRATGGTTVFDLHPSITLAALARIFALAVSGAVLAALQPAFLASRLHPVVALTRTT